VPKLTNKVYSLQGRGGWRGGEEGSEGKVGGGWGKSSTTFTFSILFAPPMVRFQYVAFLPRSVSLADSLVYVVRVLM